MLGIFADEDQAHALLTHSQLVVGHSLSPCCGKRPRETREGDPGGGEGPGGCPGIAIEDDPGVWGPTAAFERTQGAVHAPCDRTPRR